MSTGLFVPELCASFALSELRDDNAIKTVLATVASAVVYSGADLNGASVTANVAYGHERLPQFPCVTRSNNAGQFSVSPIVFTGTDEDGAAATSSCTPADINGNDVVIGDAGLVTVTSIAVPAQAGVGGTLTFGWTDIAASNKRPILQVDCAAAGTLHLTHADGILRTIDATLGQSIIAGLATQLNYADAALSAMTVDPFVVYRGRCA